MKNKKTLEMVQMAVLIAIILVMAFTSIGYIRTAGCCCSKNSKEQNNIAFHKITVAFVWKAFLS